jgi:CHY zinc finger.
LPVLVGEDEDDEENTKHINPQDIMKRIFGKKNRGEFKVGNPLPNNGACKHYKNSHRFFRFPCCGKAYPCDDCHNKVEKHDMEVIFVLLELIK